MKAVLELTSSVGTLSPSLHSLVSLDMGKSISGNGAGHGDVKKIVSMSFVNVKATHPLKKMSPCSQRLSGQVKFGDSCRNLTIFGGSRIR